MLARGAFDRVADADVSAAAADISCHSRIDISVGRIAIIGKQRRRRHDLTRLAVTALDNFKIEPGFLHFCTGLGGPDGFNRGDGAIADRAGRQQTGADRLAIEMYGASAALSDAAAVFGTGHTQYIAQHPKQRHVRINIHRACGTIDSKRDCHRYLSNQKRRVIAMISGRRPRIAVHLSAVANCDH